MFEKIINESLGKNEKIFLAFFIFTLSLALRDLLFRYLMVEEIPMSAICF